MENDYIKLAKLIRYYILLMTTSAGSGHVTSSFSAVELMITLFFKYFKYDLADPKGPHNDHLIFSKGHAAPLFYALWAVAGKISENGLQGFRNFDSVLEGHPSIRFPYTEAPTGSLGQGLSIGLGMALNDKYLDRKNNLSYVLLGDGEMAEGQVWEALELASHYKLNNLIGILDVNRLGQSGETMLGSNIESYEKRIQSFGWKTYLLHNGHDFNEVRQAYEFALQESGKGDSPFMIIAKTVKGKGVPFLEDKEGWHGKALSDEECVKALRELGSIDKSVKGIVANPEGANSKFQIQNSKFQSTNYNIGELVATRKAFGSGLVNLGKTYSDVVVLDADVKNSTYSIDFAEVFPDRFFQMYIAEQNMVSTAIGLAYLGKVPFVSTFAAFLTRACDQVRMAELADSHIVFNGSHVGVSIGEDGPSQMGLQDIAIFRSGLNNTVLYPADANAAEKLIEEAYKTKGIVYLRTTRGNTPVIYSEKEKFLIGGSKVLRSDDKDKLTLIAAGITLFEALKAADILAIENIKIRVIDAYSIKPIDHKTIQKAAKDTKLIITIEDHYPEGGLGDAVLEILAEEKISVYKMAVTKMPRSGKSEELLAYEEIDADAIVNKVKSVLTK